MTEVLEAVLLDHSDHTWVMGVSGEWDIYSTDLALTELLEQAVLQGRHLILDVSKLTFVDSTGLSRLLAVADAIAGNGCEMVLLRPTKPVLALLNATGLCRHLSLAETMEEAQALIARCRDAPE